MKPYKPETLGLMIDMSRNAVMDPETLKKTYMPLMKKIICAICNDCNHIINSIKY